MEARSPVSQEAYVLLTLHRAENTDNQAVFSELISYVANQASHRKIIFPVHPRSRALVDGLDHRPPQLECVDPVSYSAMQGLIADAETVFTDSGGLQKEAYFHRTPCVTLREETEWVETIAAGWNRLWQVPNYENRSEIADYGDGHAAEKIVNTISNWLSASR